MTRTDAQPLIRMQGVNKFFGSFQALKNINLEVHRGERIVVCGPSGSGKSTMIRCINRLEEHNDGHIIIDGKELTDQVNDINAVRREVGMVFQSFNLFPHMTIVKNLMLAQQLVRKLSKAEARDTAMHYLERVKIPEQAEKYPIALSGGQQQRVAIARALYHDPPILMLDEATSALDAEGERLVQAAIERVMQGRTAVVIAHRLSTVRHADRIIVMDRGGIAESGSHEQLMAAGGVYHGMVALQQLEG